MSQITKTLTSGGPIPPVIPTSFQTQNGSAVPAANILIVDAFDSTENNENGITTKGGTAAGDPPGTGLPNEESIYLTNRITGTATTTDGVTPVLLSTFNLGAVPATYLMDIKVIGYNITDSLSAGYISTSTFRTTGAAATEVSANPNFISEELTMTGVVVQNQITGNSVETYVTGLAGKTIHWKTLKTYIMVV